MKLFCILVLISMSSWAQSEYPQDYFRHPLDITTVLSGTFAELRPSHFHAGLDIKTQRKTGLKVYAAAEGYVSRIKVSHFGYGKALYITHPNGYTTVYAHLKKFSEPIERYVKSIQYDKESYEMQVFPKPEELLISKNDIIGYSGNTGSSGAPHLHFEIRDNLERPINPMLFGITVKDSKPPLVKGLFAYPKNDTTTINGKNERVKLRLIPKGSGAFSAEKINAHGQVGFGIITNDQQNLAPNHNGVYQIETLYNGNKSLKVDFRRFSFSETNHIKRYIDYDYYKSKKKRIQKLFIEPNNPLNLFTYAFDNGYVRVEDSTASVYKIIVKDFNNNASVINVPIVGKKQPITEKKNETINKFLISENSTTTLEAGNATISFYPNTVYDDTFIDFRHSADTLFIHEDKVPLRKDFKITYDISNYDKDHRNYLFIAKLVGYYKYPVYQNTKRTEHTLSTQTDDFGMYTVKMDTVAPEIKPLNFKNKQWLSKYRYLKLKISDELSGISNYRATVNGKWILMEYDYKTDTLNHDFNDDMVTDTKNELKVIVTDNVGNSATFEAVFYRK